MDAEEEDEAEEEDGHGGGSRGGVRSKGMADGAGGQAAADFETFVAFCATCLSNLCEHCSGVRVASRT